MHQSEKEIFLVKVQEIETKIQELKTWVDGLEFKEASLFDNVEDNPVLVPTESAESAITADAAPRNIRQRTNDGSMTATSIARKLSKELGRNITRVSVILVGKRINAKATYCERQHISRYSQESVKMIMDIFKDLYTL